MDYKLIQLFEGQFGSIRKTFMIKFGKYMCVSRNKKHTKMFTGLSLAGKFMGDFYFPLNIFQILLNKPNFICLNTNNTK